jgi:hypothetical protein
MRKYSLEQVQRYRRLFDTEDGRWILADLKRLFSDKSSFDPGNPRVSDFNEGMRYVFLHIEAVRAFETKPLIAEILKHEETDE